MNELHLKYKKDTGKDATASHIEIGVARKKGQWVIEDLNDFECLQTFGRFGTLTIPDPEGDYTKWLEDKLIELLNKR